MEYVNIRSVPKDTIKIPQRGFAGSVSRARVGATTYSLEQRAAQ